MPEDFRQSRAYLVLQKAIRDDRLAHGILLYGPSLPMLEEAMFSLAATLLECTGPVNHHPDFFVLRPTNKMRQISIEDTRELIRKINVSPSVAQRKVAVVYEVDRMNKYAVNAFLKTLEEPPADTTLFLITSQPYQLLDTVRSRCLHFHIADQSVAQVHPSLREWLERYRHWLAAVYGLEGNPKTSELIFGLYGLVDGYQTILQNMSDEQWASIKDTLDEMTPEEKDAAETGLRKSIRSHVLRSLSMASRESAVHFLGTTDTLPASPLIESIRMLEKMAGLLEVNFNETAALECFLLHSLRVWHQHRPS